MIPPSKSVPWQRGQGDQTRISKSETNSKPQIQMPKTNAIVFWIAFRFGLLSLEFLDCFGFRASDFEFTPLSPFEEEVYISIVS
jgi:hypothetical protein